jgi:mono/diheme cytochrome c family protein
VAAASCFFMMAGAALADGRALYHGYQTFAGGSSVTETGRPAGLLHCAACHGPLASGNDEGGSVAPSLQWRKLTSHAGAAAAYNSEAAVADAIARGVGRNGKPLLALMPRYSLNPDEMRDLLAYLKRAGTESDMPQGVSHDEISLGALVPLSGELSAAGRSVLKGLGAVIDSANASGGINGRRVRLSVADASEAGGLKGAEHLAKQPVFAVVAGLWTSPDGEVERTFAEHQVSMIASLTQRDEGGAAKDWSFGLLASAGSQRQALQSAMLACDAPGDHVVFGMASDNDRIKTIADPRLLADSASPGCVGYDIGHIDEIRSRVPPGWSERVVLPFPSAFAVSQGENIWESLGIASGKITLELLAASGRSLHERSLLENLSQLSGFEILPGMTLPAMGRRRFVWQPEILELGGSGANGNSMVIQN